MACRRSGVEHKLLVLAACDCAETALKYVPKGENRPAKCIQITRDWCNGTASLDDVRAARRDADDAADAAAARRGMHKICADLVRKRIPVSLIKL